jgi:ABC-type transporter Mla maintaining outer membrane lipid asymmetry ATPase subunit MlaF
MAAGGDILIRTEQLSKRFRSGEDELVIFSGLDLEVRRGERLAIIGESGAGKSTLLYLLGALDRPSSGTIHFGHRDISRFSDAELAESAKPGSWVRLAKSLSAAGVHSAGERDDAVVDSGRIGWGSSPSFASEVG